VTLSLTFWTQSGSGWNAGKDARRELCPKPRPFPPVQSLESRWEAVEHDQMHFIEALTPQRLGEELSYINQKGQRYSYPLSHQLVHVVNHSSYHRGQVITLLRQLGAETASTDFLAYFDERPKSQR